jgi:hypothetical protein
VANASPASLKGSTAKSVPAKQASVKAAIDAQWPKGIPEGLTAGQRNRRIITWQGEPGLAVVSDRTIDHYLSANRSK